MSSPWNILEVIAEIISDDHVLRFVETFHQVAAIYIVCTTHVGLKQFEYRVIPD